MPGLLAALLRDRSKAILDDWTGRVLADPRVPDANRLSVPALHDHIPELLDHIARALKEAEAGRGEATARELDGGEAAHAHAKDRVAHRYSLKEALRELSHLRAAIVEICTREGVPLEGVRARVVHASIDEAMSTVAVGLERAANAAKDLEHERLRAVLRLMPVGVFIADAEGNILETNPAAERIWGGPPPKVGPSEYARYQGWWTETGEPIRAEEWAMLRALQSGDACLDEEVDIVGFDGARRTILNSALPIRDAAGTLVGGVAVNVDITEHKQIERELRREAVFRDRFMGILGHDLRNPLTSITFSAATLLRREDLPDSVDKPIKRIATSADRMKHMIEELLDVTRIRGGGGIPLDPRPTDLLGVARQVVGELEVTHPSREITFKHRGNLQGTWDPGRIAQVISNLVGNAVDHSPPDSPVRVNLWSAGEEEVALEVHNLGAPIPPELRATIFDPFRRAVAKEAPSASRGLGLGLHIVEQIVRAHGGSIEVRSEAEEGTTFTVRLPRARLLG